jgi:signal transduction histidine kinase
VVLAVAGITLVLVQKSQLETLLRTVASQQAADVAVQVAGAGVAPVQLKASGSGEPALVQVLSANGDVLAASPAIHGARAMIGHRPGPGESLTVHVDSLGAVEDGPFVVAARGVAAPGGDRIVLAAQSLESVQQATDVVEDLLSFGLPVLVLSVALISYWFVGRTLRPVEDIRRRVAQITATDLTSRVPVPHPNDEVRDLAMTMNAMLARLETATGEQRQFVADASHELRSPLAAIRASHEVAQAVSGDTDWPGISADVLAELDRLDRLVADLLLLARADQQSLNPLFEDVDLDHLVADEAGRLERQLRLRVDVHNPPVRIRGDRHQLARALRNLTDNASRHADSWIGLRLEADGDEAQLHVEDDGPGIPKEDRARVFDRFVRLDSSRHRDAGNSTGGAGLGLSIARDLARAHDGDVTIVDSDNGAHFVLTLPRHRDTAS